MVVNSMSTCSIKNYMLLFVAHELEDMDAWFTTYHVLNAFQHNLLPIYYLTKEGRSKAYLGVAIASIVLCCYDLNFPYIVSLIMVTYK